MNAIAEVVETGDEVTLAHEAFNLCLVSDEPLILFRRRSWLRWEATLWQAERVETTQATYTYATLMAIGYGGTRWSARRALNL